MPALNVTMNSSINIFCNVGYKHLYRNRELRSETTNLTYIIKCEIWQKKIFFVFLPLDADSASSIGGRPSWSNGGPTFMESVIF